MDVNPQALNLLLQRAHAAQALESDVPSPCISVCAMNAQTGFCQGCLRNLQEIAGWSVATDAQKKQVWATLEQRLLSRPRTSNGDFA
jgi:predicted Fe-S protein YdhL (DUF1289 family)